MASRIDDRLLWLGLGITLFLTTKGIQYAIRDTIHLTEVKADNGNHSKEHDKRPEDSISLKTLEVLATSPNPTVSNAVISQVVMRFLKHPDSQELLEADVLSSDPERRRQARTATTFLLEWPLPPGSDTPLPPAISGFGNRIRSIRSTDAVRNAPYSHIPEWHQDDTYQDLLVPSDSDPVANWVAVPRERPTGGSPEEAEVRRGRREAMVLHEGAGGVAEGDIIRPRREP